MRVLDLFCGAGGFSEGFRQAGFEITTALDWDEKALQSHEINHPDTHHILGDIKEKKKEIISNGPYDIVIGSPPCQQFSSANNSNPDPEKGMELVNEFISLVRKLKPKYWIGENVGPSKKHIKQKYHLTSYLLNSADYGVPQKRNRFFFGKFKLPNSTHAKVPILTLDGRELQKWQTVAEILDENEQDWMDFEDLPNTAKKRVLDYGYQKIPKFNYNKLVNPRKPAGTVPAHKDVAYLLLVQSGNSNGNGKYIQEIFEPGWTITTRQNHFISNKILFRKLSLLEIKRIMGFDDSYSFVGGTTDQIKQMGNAVCPPVAKAIGKALLEGFN